MLFKYKKLVIGTVAVPPKEIAPILKYKNSFGEGVPYGDPNSGILFIANYFKFKDGKAHIITKVI